MTGPVTTTTGTCVKVWTHLLLCKQVSRPTVTLGNRRHQNRSSGAALWGVSLSIHLFRVAYSRVPTISANTTSSTKPEVQNVDTITLNLTRPISLTLLWSSVYLFPKLQQNPLTNVYVITKTVWKTNRRTTVKAERPSKLSQVKTSLLAPATNNLLDCACCGRAAKSAHSDDSDDGDQDEHGYTGSDEDDRLPR